MKLYNGTGCYVHLIGVLLNMPQKDDQKHFIIVSRKSYLEKKKIIQYENYRVFLNKKDSDTVASLAFPGVVIGVHGDLYREDSTAITAEKIEFLSYPGHNISEAAPRNCDTKNVSYPEMAYWFLRNGDLRPELTYMH